jgi:Ca2+-binding EF-hand superfamily protein
MSSQVNMTSWEQLMEMIDINGDGKISIEEMGRQA